MHWFFEFIFGIKLYKFQAVFLSIIRSLSLYTQLWYMSYRFADSLQAFWIPNTTNTHSQYVIIGVVSNATVVAQMHLSVMLYEHCLSCMF